MQDFLSEVKTHDLKNALPITETTRIRAAARMEQIAAEPYAVTLRGVAGSRRLDSATARRMTVSTTARGMTAGAAMAAGNPKLKKWGLRLAAVPVLAAGIIAASVMLPGPTGSTPAFASWTPHPSAVPGAALDQVSDLCFRGLLVFSSGTGIRLTTEALGAPTFAEQRGDWLNLGYVVDDMYAGCLILNTDDSQKVQQFWVVSDGITIIGIQPRSSQEGYSGDGVVISLGSAGVPTSGPEVGRDFNRLTVTQIEVPGEGLMRTMIATVDDDVESVSIQIGENETVEATVANGVAAAWWPVQNSRNASQPVPAGSLTGNADFTVVQTVGAEGEGDYFTVQTQVSECRINPSDSNLGINCAPFVVRP